MIYQLEIPEQKLSGWETKRAIATALAASVFLGLMPILIRISQDFLSPNATVFNRFWIGTIIQGLWNGLLPNRKTNFAIKDTSNIKRLLVWLLVLSIVFTLTQLLWSLSLAQTTVANSEILHCFSPKFTTLAGWLLFTKRFGNRFLTGMVITTGVAIAIGVSDISYSVSLKGDGLALLSAVFWGGYIMSMEKLRSYLSPTMIVMWASVSCAVLSRPVILITNDGMLPNGAESWLTLILLGFNTIACHGLMAYSLKWLSSALMATILLCSPILTAVVGWALFSETLSQINLFGLAVILVGIYLATSDEGELKTPEK